MNYTELQVTTHFSFLRGVSSCDELFAAAKLLGYDALGVTDRNSVAGLVRALVASKATGCRLIAGCRLDLVEACPEREAEPGRQRTSILVWPEDRAAWSRLTRLLTVGKSRADAQRGQKGQCFLYWEDVAAWSEGLVAALLPGEADAATEAAQVERLRSLRARRDNEAVETSLAALEAAARTPDENLLPHILSAVEVYSTVGEISHRLRRVWGEYQEAVTI